MAFVSTMQDRPLLISSILEHVRRVYGDSRVVTAGAKGEGRRVAAYAEVAERAERLAGALASLGVSALDRVGTFSLLDEIPKTSVGKFDKKRLRKRHEAGGLDVVSVSS